MEIYLDLTKAGDGTLVLSGSSTYSGATNMSLAGTIISVTSGNSLGSLSWNQRYHQRWHIGRRRRHNLQQHSV